MTKKIHPGLTLHNLRGTNNHGNCKAVICSDNGKQWASGVDCAEELGVTPWAVSQCCLGKTRTCKGLHLHYAYDDIVDPLCNRIQEQEHTMHNLTSIVSSKQAEINDLHGRDNNIKAAMEYKRRAKQAYEDALAALEAAKAAEEAAKAEYEQAMAQFETLLEKLF